MLKRIALKVHFRQFCAKPNSIISQNYLIFHKTYVFSHDLRVTYLKNLSTKSIGFPRNITHTTTYQQSVNMPEIRFDEVKTLLEEDKITFVDVREPKELSSDGKIPGSINIPLGELEAAFNLPPEKVKEKYGKPLPLADDAEKLILSCRSGRRAASAFDIAAKFGYQKARCYFGSFLDWQEKGGPLEK